MGTLAWIILATLAVSLLSLLGVLTISLSDKLLKKILLALVGLAAGTLIGSAFLHLIPEALLEFELHSETDTLFIFVLVGFVIFFILEKFLWRHCHDKTCKIHTFAYMNLIGDGIHNFIDGLIIAAGFLASVEIGLVTTLAVAVHEIPQEIGDFGVLVHGGFEKKKALMFNLLTAITALIGGLLGFFLIPELGEFQIYIIPIAAGGFIYIAAADLVPEIHKERNVSKTVLAFTMFVLGIFFTWFVKFIFEGGLH